MKTDITVTTEERVQLAGLIADCNSPAKVVWRSRIVLATADGESVKAICRATGMSKPCVWRWQKRFAEYGVDGLQNGHSVHGDGRLRALATRTLCFDTRMLRQTNGFVAAHHLTSRSIVNKRG